MFLQEIRWKDRPSYRIAIIEDWFQRKSGQKLYFMDQGIWKEPNKLWI